MPINPPSPGLAPSQPATVSHPPQPSTPHEPQAGVQLPHESGVLAQLPGSQLVQEDFDPQQPAKPAAKPIVRSIKTPRFIANFLFYHALGERPSIVKIGPIIGRVQKIANTARLYVTDTTRTPGFGRLLRKIGKIGIARGIITRSVSEGGEL